MHSRSLCTGRPIFLKRSSAAGCKAQWLRLVLLLMLGLLSATAGQAQPGNGFFDHFDGSTLDPRWVTLTSGGGTVAVTDSCAEMNSPAASDAAAFYYHLKLDKAQSQLWVFAISNDSGAVPQWWVTVLNSASAPVAESSASLLARVRARAALIQSGSANAIAFDYFDSVRTRRVWNGSAWTTGGVANAPVRADDYSLVGLEFDGPNARWRMMAWGRRSGTPGGYTLDQGLKLFALTDWVPWTGMEATDDLWLVVGDQLQNGLSGRMRVEWVRHDRGPRQEVWVNGSSGSGGYRIRHWHGYEGANGAVEQFVPQDRTTLAVDIGPPGAWDATALGVKDQYVVRDGSTYYLFYGGTEIGVASASDVNGPWIKSSNNPIIPKILGGEEETLGFPKVVKDLGEADPQKTWKMLYAGVRSDSFHRVFYATAPAATGPWTRQGRVLDVGGPGAIDEMGVAAGTPVWWNNQWHVFLSVRDASANGFWSVSYATGPSFTQLTKSNVQLVPKSAVGWQPLTVNLNGRVVNVADTSAFTRDAEVIVRRSAALSNDFGVSRVRKIVNATQLELYHGLDGFLASGPAEILQVDSWYLKNAHADTVQFGATWYLFLTNFADGRESHGVLASANLTGPYTWQHAATPGATLSFFGGSKSNENLVFVHDPVNTSSAPDETPPVITGVMAVSVTGTGATIEWSTDEPADSQVEYGETPTYGSVTPVDANRVTTHAVNLSGLLADTEYHFRVRSTDAAGNTAVSGDFTLQTLTVDNSPPQVNLTAPADGAVVLGAAVQVTADASDDAGVAGVQFLLNGASLGAEDTAAPYETVWDTTAVDNGGHMLAARARDASGNETTSPAVAVTVANNRALQFDGVDDALAGPVVSPPGQISVSMWIKPISLGQNSGGHLFAIQDLGDNNPNVHLRLAPGNVLRLVATFDNGGQLSIGAWDTPAGSVALSVLQHVALVYDSSSPLNAPAIFVNGTALPVTSIRTATGTLRNQSGQLVIGNNAGTFGTFHGLIDEVRIYSRLLSGAEVATHFNGGQINAGLPEAGLLAGWHLDERTGTTAVDYSGNGNHAVLVNNPTRILN
jgi:hypothetical protein